MLSCHPNVLFVDKYQMYNLYFLHMFVIQVWLWVLAYLGAVVPLASCQVLLMHWVFPCLGFKPWTTLYEEYLNMHII